MAQADYFLNKFFPVTRIFVSMEVAFYEALDQEVIQALQRFFDFGRMLKQRIQWGIAVKQAQQTSALLLQSLKAVRYFLFQKLVFHKR